MEKNKVVYLWDGLYASFDGYQIKLMAPREFGDSAVYLEYSVLREFLDYLEHTGYDLVKRQWKDE